MNVDIPDELAKRIRDHCALRSPIVEQRILGEIEALFPRPDPLTVLAGKEGWATYRYAKGAEWTRNRWDNVRAVHNGERGFGVAVNLYELPDASVACSLAERIVELIREATA